MQNTYKACDDCKLIHKNRQLFTGGGHIGIFANRARKNLIIIIIRRASQTGNNCDDFDRIVHGDTGTQERVECIFKTINLS